jgi:hypothetical protein
MRILIVGTNVRNIAESAKKAGHEVFALTKFDDEDLKLYAKVEKITGDVDWVMERVKGLAEELNAGVILSTGYEDLKVNAEILGTNPKEAAKIKDKLRFYRSLEKAGILFPEFVNIEDADVICKPRIGGGGERTFLNKTLHLEKDREYIFQRYINGIPCSISLIAGKEVYPIASNEILAGWKEMNAENFRYSGNITPLVNSEAKKELAKIAIETAELFDLSGSIGVDFVLADKPYVLEINPRFQGSLDSIEWSYDINLFKLHMLGVEGKNIEIPKPKRYAARAIFFAEKHVEIKTNLAGNPFFADVPPAGFYKKDEPLVSILASGHSRENILGKVLERKNAFLSVNKGLSVNKRLWE